MENIRIVVDSWAWIEYFDESEKGVNAKKYIDDEKNEIFVNSLIVAEVMSAAIRKGKNAPLAFEAICELSKSPDISNPEFAKDVGATHARMKQKIKDFGLADAFILQTARELNAKLLTGDSHFKDFKEAIML